MGDHQEEKLFLMMLNSMMQIYPYAVICKTREWEEYSYRCKFVQLTDTSKLVNPSKFVVSKWFFEVSLIELV